jgi:hypothetical protein
MRNIVLASCLAIGLMMSSVGQNTAQADHGYGYRAPSCGYGQGGGFRGYSAGYGLYPSAFGAPGLGVYSRSGYSAARFGYPSAFGGYGRGFAPVVVAPVYGYGVGYGNVYGQQTLPRVQLRIGF